MYTQMLANVIRRHNVQHQNYADDTQVYVSCEDTEDARSAAIVKLQTWISDMCEGIRANALMLNETKIDCIVLVEIKIQLTSHSQYAHSQSIHNL